MEVKLYGNDMIMGLKQKKIKFRPRIKLNPNISSGPGSSKDVGSV